MPQPQFTDEQIKELSALVKQAKLDEGNLDTFRKDTAEIMQKVKAANQLPPVPDTSKMDDGGEHQRRMLAFDKNSSFEKMYVDAAFAQIDETQIKDAAKFTKAIQGIAMIENMTHAQQPASPSATPAAPAGSQAPER